MLLTKEVEIIPTGKMIQYYKNLGYDAKYRQPLIVKIKDLSKGSKTKVAVLCDICRINKSVITYLDYNMSLEKTGSHVCEQCRYEKAFQTNRKKYGVEHPLQAEFFKEKSRHVCLERYGFEYAGQVKECQEKKKQTCLEKYNAEFASQSDIVKEKIKQTNLERYGFENVGQVLEFKEKQINTFRERYNVDNPMQCPEIKEKAAKTLCLNSTQKTSKQQLYLHNLYGGELNYQIKYYDADICLPDEKIIIEYDGSGHSLNVKYGQLSQEEFNEKEIIRFNVIKREGYKQIRIISLRDKLPNDNILLQMLLDAKSYFSATNHSWMNYDIDNSRMINAENKYTNGIFYDYGNLHTIKEAI